MTFENTAYVASSDSSTSGTGTLKNRTSSFISGSSADTHGNRKNPSRKNATTWVTVATPPATPYFTNCTNGGASCER